ncbi:uncharacterized protein BDR25DRAFT_351459 [Lindgomyces ingoldianus]|uniref:Uncharacterized protein n=1 Tax=Lindgomyces ingoldianus TaxID=673940 RepID=A0ACB6R6V1_9PLEO|nr:uncharacterized protein BDR25DRAFT_351459 [Lindgomyces ingoldianus]KAF2474969.1 hypothetical protein BDR25DRAFT_351459 [Lindgomyces ingoldianus]
MSNLAPKPVQALSTSSKTNTSQHSFTMRRYLDERESSQPALRIPNEQAERQDRIKNALEKSSYRVSETGSRQQYLKKMINPAVEGCDLVQCRLWGDLIPFDEGKVNAIGYRNASSANPMAFPGVVKQNFEMHRDEYPKLFRRFKGDNDISMKTLRMTEGTAQLRIRDCDRGGRGGTLCMIVIELVVHIQRILPASSLIIIAQTPAFYLRTKVSDAVCSYWMNCRSDWY